VGSEVTAQRTRSVGPGGWWSWPAVAFVAALAPFAARSDLTVPGLPPLTVWGSACLLLMVAMWWDDLAPRAVWNSGGFVVRGPHGLHRGAWPDARSVFLVALGGGRHGYRLVLVTPTGRYELVPDRFWRLARASDRHVANIRRAIEDIRSTRDAAGTVVGVPPRLMPPLAQLMIVFFLWAAGLTVGLILS
jgi:hypothetical protein